MKDVIRYEYRPKYIYKRYAFSPEDTELVNLEMRINSTKGIFYYRAKNIKIKDGHFTYEVEANDNMCWNIQNGTVCIMIKMKKLEEYSFYYNNKFEEKITKEIEKSGINIMRLTLDEYMIKEIIE